MSVRPCLTSPYVLCWIPLVLASLSGCASDSDAVEKRLAELREDIRKLQNDSDRVGERLEAVELRQARAEAAANTPARSAAAPGNIERPRLKVLHLAPGEGGEQPVEQVPAEDGRSRVILKGEGKDLELKQAPGDSSSRSNQRDKTLALRQDQPQAPAAGAN